VGEELPSEKHPVVADTERVHVCLVAVFEVVEHLWGHVQRGAQHGLSEIVLAEDLAETEVCNFGDSIVAENIGQLQVPMQDLVIEEMVEPIDDFAKNLDGFFLCEVFSFLDVGIEVAIVAVLEHKVVIVGGLLHVVELDDVVALAALKHLDLALQQLLEFAYLTPSLPFTPSRRIDLTAMSLLVALS